MSEREKINQQIIDLQAALSSNSSRTGDWAILKCWEASQSGKEIPYDLNNLLEKREAIRKQINELQKQLESLPEEDEKK